MRGIIGSIICGLSVVIGLAVVAPDLGIADLKWWIAVVVVNVGYPLGEAVRRA
jgi:hypothetical protein